MPAVLPTREIYALRSEPNETFEWLDRSFSNRDSDIVWLLIDPFILRYKDDPRFAVFCRKVGLPVPGKRPRASPPHPGALADVRFAQSEWQVPRGGTGCSGRQRT